MLLCWHCVLLGVSLFTEGCDTLHSGPDSEAKALPPKACVQCLEVFLEDSDKSTEWLVFTQCNLG